MLEISDRFPRADILGKKYPRVYLAKSIEDMQKGRAEHARGLHRRVDMVPSNSFGNQPCVGCQVENNAIIYLPEVQHYTALDPQENIKRMGGATLHDNLGMRISDNSDRQGIPVWFHECSLMDFPFKTTFHDIDFLGIATFDLNKWKEYRELSWRRGVIVMAQYTDLSRAELKILKQQKKEGANFTDYRNHVTELYWLLHIIDPEGIVRKKGKERITVPVRRPVPVFPPIIR